MEVSVIIPVYNQKPEYFKEALDSVLNQTVAPCEIIVVDDGSEILKIPKQNKMPLIPIKVIRNEKNMGIGYSRQKGVEEAKGEYIAFLSSDDIWDKNFLKVMVENALVNPDKILYCAYYIINEKGEIINIFNPPNFENYDDFCIACWNAAERNTMFVNFSSIFIPKKVFDKVKFDKTLRYCEDLDFLLRSMKHFQYHLVNEPLLRYRATDNLTNKILNKIPEQNKKIREKCLRYWKSQK